MTNNNEQVNLSLKKVVGKGYFAKELPKEFSSMGLGEVVDDLRNNNFRKKQENRESIPAHFTIPKVSHVRRNLSVPTPRLQIELSKSIVDNFDQIMSFISESEISLTIPSINESSSRGIDRKYNFDEKKYKRIELATSSRYILKADFLRYYPSIYTHSIPWAIHGKEVAKLDKSDSLIGNLLDKRVRNLQDKQTLGIPIGPDTSLIISEIIGTAIDKELSNEIQNLKGFRYTDDIELYFEEKYDAEKALNTLQQIIKNYELELNSHKTGIISMPTEIEPSWIPELKLYNFRENEKPQKNDLISFFSKSFEFAKKYTDESVLKYSVKKVANNKFKLQNWPIIEALLLNTILVDARVIPDTIPIFKKYKEEGANLNYEKIKETIGQVLKLHSPLKNDFETAWILSLSNQLGLNIDRAIVNILKGNKNPFISIMTLDAYQNGYIEEIETSVYTSMLSADNLYNSNWIFTYEVLKKGWLPDDDNIIEEDRFYKQLFDKNVEFYTESKDLHDDRNELSEDGTGTEYIENANPFEY